MGINLDIDLTSSGKDVHIAFDPLKTEWSIEAVNEMEQSSASCEDLDLEYGPSHRRYVVDKRREQGSLDAEAQVDQEFQEARRAAARWADEEARDRARNRASTILSNHKQVRQMLQARRGA